MFGYFLPGVRHLTAYVAGTSQFSFAVFALFAYTGALLWPVTFLSVGYIAGEEWQVFAEALQPGDLPLLQGSAARRSCYEGP
jgi:membrane protein DedA with SNARE-associated domain